MDLSHPIRLGLSHHKIPKLLACQRRFLALKKHFFKIRIAQLDSQDVSLAAKAQGKGFITRSASALNSCLSKVKCWVLQAPKKGTKPGCLAESIGDFPRFRGEK